MIFNETSLASVYIIEIEAQVDERGLFARTWCETEFAERGLVSQLAQTSISLTTEVGTIRGLHYQAAPVEETKLVRCTRGAIYDVVVDLRRGSPTRGRYTAVELTAINHRALYIPADCAHGLQTLTAETEVLYAMDVPYHADAARGVRWDDPDLAIEWPLPVSQISPRDRSLPTYRQIREDR